MNRKKEERLSSDMTVLDIVSTFPETEAVFRAYDEQARECICCQSLFETLQQVGEKYKLDTSELLGKLNSAIVD